MNYRLSHNVELVERDGEMFLMSKTPLCVLRLNRSLADLVGRGIDGSPIVASETEQRVMEQLVAKGFAERVRTISDLPATLPRSKHCDPGDESGRRVAPLPCLSLPAYLSTGETSHCRRGRRQ